MYENMTTFWEKVLHKNDCTDVEMQGEECYAVKR